MYMASYFTGQYLKPKVFETKEITHFISRRKCTELDNMKYVHLFGSSYFTLTDWAWVRDGYEKKERLVNPRELGTKLMMTEISIFVSINQ